ncbi:MAG: ParB/RepB/Spo0J family partition protein [Elusimicrobia bacterium]|nr:ParB/RepB/Spo0J family partition protein [Elusimicrobiota bacterium]
MKKRALGRGLDSLIPIDKSASDRISELDIKKIIPNRYQMRTVFDDDKIRELAETIKESGIFQPLLVTRKKDGFMLIAGERRLRAAKLAGLKKIPAIVRDYEEEDMLIVSLVENIQREDLSPVEEAGAYKRMQEEFSMTQADIAARVGKSRSTVANTLRILSLPEDLIDLVASGALSAGHARALLSVENPAKMLNLAQKIVKEKLTVREAEDLSKNLRGGKPKKRAVLDATGDESTAKIESLLEKALGTRVRIKMKKQDKTSGKIEVEFYSLDDFDRIYEIITGKKFS